MATKKENTAPEAVETENTAPEVVAEMADPNRRVDIFIERGYANDEPNLLVSVNGKNFLLPKGKTSTVPAYVADERVKTFYDTLEAYMPTKDCTMTIYNKNGTTTTYNKCIMENYGNYLAFLSGDHGYMVINVPENPQDKNILVIKDSYGNAFVPYLTEHYGNIVVVDPRYADLNIFDFYDDYKFEDIVFMVNIMSSNNSAWYKYLLNLLS
jgi:hypothetical protein